MESYLAIQNDIWPLAATWVDLVGIMLSEVKSEKDKCCMRAFTYRI